MTALFQSIPINDPAYVPLEKRIKQGIVPLRLEAAVFEGSDVRARFLASSCMLIMASDSAGEKR